MKSMVDLLPKQPQKIPTSRSKNKSKEVGIPTEGVGRNAKKNSSEKKRDGLLLRLKNIFKKRLMTEGRGRGPGEKKTPAEGGISLMPKQVPVSPRLFKEKIKFLMTVLVITLLAVGAIYYFLDLAYREREKKVDAIKSETKRVREEIDGYASLEEKISLLERKAGRAQNLLKDHIYWTRLFYFLEKYTIPEVAYEDFAGDISGKLSLPATAKDFISAARQLAIFQNATDFVKEASISGIAGSKKGGVRFTISLTLKENIFIK